MLLRLGSRLPTRQLCIDDDTAVNALKTKARHRFL